jgi:hypothetical protein
VRFRRTNRVLDMGKELREAPSAHCAAFLGRIARGQCRAL